MMIVKGLRWAAHLENGMVGGEGIFADEDGKVLFVAIIHFNANIWVMDGPFPVLDTFMNLQGDPNTFMEQMFGRYKLEDNETLLEDLAEVPYINCIRFVYEALAYAYENRRLLNTNEPLYYVEKYIGMDVDAPAEAAGEEAGEELPFDQAPLASALVS